MDKELPERDSATAEAARAMGKKRWQGTSEAERQEFMAKARARIKLTKAERSEIGRKAVNARWAKARAAKDLGKSKTKQGTRRKGGTTGIP
jgi:hypothetical protein